MSNGTVEINIVHKTEQWVFCTFMVLVCLLSLILFEGVAGHVGNITKST